MLATFGAILFVDKLGRRKLLIIASVWMFVTQVIVAGTLGAEFQKHGADLPRAVSIGMLVVRTGLLIALHYLRSLKVVSSCWLDWHAGSEIDVGPLPRVTEGALLPAAHPAVSLDDGLVVLLPVNVKSSSNCTLGCIATGLRAETLCSVQSPCVQENQVRALLAAQTSRESCSVLRPALNLLVRRLLTSLPWVAAQVICVYICGHAYGWGPIGWLYPV